MRFAPLLVLALMVAGCSTPQGAPDKDGDGVPDAAELLGAQITVDLLGVRTIRTVTSDPALADTDGDGIPDGTELVRGTDPRSADTDEDGLSDCQEEVHTVLAECEAGLEGVDIDGGYGTDARNADSDHGGGRYVNNVLRFQDPTGTINVWPIPWGDGISDGDEVAGYEVQVNGRTRMVQTDPTQADTDADNLEDGEERFLYGSDPLVADTDGDGCMDGLDPLPTKEETYAAGLQSLRLADHVGDAQLRISMVYVDNAFDLPEGSNLAASPGQDIDLTGLSPSGLRPAYCSYPPYEPFVRLQLHVADMDGGVRHLDLGSSSSAYVSAGQPATLWLHVRDGTFHDDPQEPPLEAQGGRVTLHGPDGSITLAPSAS